MKYQQFGLSEQLVERMRRKAKPPEVRKRLKEMFTGVTKNDLQDRKQVKRLLKMVSKELEEPVNVQETERIVNFVIGQKIDPNNTFHLLRLWGMFH